MRRSTTPVPQRILTYAANLPEGEVFGAKELLAFGSRAAVDQALARLAREGALLRIARGAYVRPVVGRFGPRAPSADAVARSWARTRGEDLAPAPVAAANELGLTTQNPVQPVYATSGRTRQLAVGSVQVKLQHAPRWVVRAPSGAGGTVLRAAAWLGPARSRSSLPSLIRALAPEERRVLTRSLRMAPVWVSQAAALTPPARAVGRTRA